MLHIVPRAKKSASPDAYQIKITLRGSRPPIWRRFIVPGSVTFEELHYVIQNVMGWYDSHLHSFEIDREEYTQRSREGVSMLDEGEDQRRFRLCDVVPAAKSRFRYIYDFGDGWEHILVVEKIIPASENPQTFVCLAGKGRSPPEDCGGIWGYYNLLEILGNPKHPDHASMKEWTGRRYRSPGIRSRGDQSILCPRPQMKSSRANRARAAIFPAPRAGSDPPKAVADC